MSRESVRHALRRPLPNGTPQRDFPQGRQALRYVAETIRNAGGLLLADLCDAMELSGYEQPRTRAIVAVLAASGYVAVAVADDFVNWTGPAAQ